MSETTARKLGQLISQWYDAAADRFRPASKAYPLPVSDIAGRSSYYFAVGQSAGYTVKTGAGKLAKVILSQITVNSVLTIYDNTAASGTVLFVSGALPATTLPCTIDFSGLAFSIGLTFVVATANLSAVFVYE